MPVIECLPKLIEARKRFANGAQTDYFEDPHCIGFVRQGTAEEPGCVVVLSNGEPGEIDVDLGTDAAGASYVDYLGHRKDRITLDDSGHGSFPCNGGSVSVWVMSE